MTILTDPHWGARASPLSWAGPRRLGPPGLAFEDLPRIDVVVISHDHYDHLDPGTVTRLAAAHDPLFLVPLGLKAWFADSGITRVEELDWWDDHEHRGVRFVCVPAQHFSQRDPLGPGHAALGLVGRGGRESAALLRRRHRLLRRLRRRAGGSGPSTSPRSPSAPISRPAIMRFVHTTPEQAVQAFEDLGARVLLGIHWGTFDLADEPLDEPPVRMLAEARRRGPPRERAWILKIGETRRW